MGREAHTYQEQNLACRQKHKEGILGFLPIACSSLWKHSPIGLAGYVPKGPHHCA